jgi:parallel beta-helix repeat protein
MKKYFIVFLSLLIFFPVFAKTFYVSNNGNNGYNGEFTDSAFATLQYAADIVSEGDSVLVLPGDYQGFDLRGVDGTESNPIVFMALGDSVRITSNNPRTDDGINLESPDWVVIDGFTVTGVPRNGIRLVTAEHITIKNNTCLNNSRGILTGFVEDVVIENNLCAYSWDEHGIYHSNSGDNPIIRYNVCHDNNGCGIHMNGDESMGGDGLITNATVEGNIIYGNGAAGGSGINCDGVANSKIFNNLIYDNHASGISLYRIDASDGSYNTKVYNNTIINAPDGRWCVNIGLSSEADSVYNNILITLHSWRGSISVSNESLTGFYSDYNILLDRMSVDGGDSRINLSEWRALGYDNHSMLANSMHHIFADWENGNYHLLPTSQAVDSGTSIVSVFVKNDLDGVSRPFGDEYDIGAYEYNPSGINFPDEKKQNPCKVIIRRDEVVFDSLEPNQIIEIFDIKGSLIHKSNNITSSTYRYNIENLKSGIYFWHVNNNKGNKIKGKIVIAR